jgi:hypothetical protein
MGRLPDLVRDSKLETQPGTHGDTIHIFRDPSRQRRTTERERWRYKSLIGHGGGGVVWLQEKVTKRSTSASVETRAVKAIKVDEPHEPKSTHQLSIAEQYVRELEALAKFSQRKVRVFPLSFAKKRITETDSFVPVFPLFCTVLWVVGAN